MQRCLLFLSLTACGRIGIDERSLDVDASAGEDASADDALAIDSATVDGPVDMPAMLSCPADMTRLSATSSVCIEIADHAPMLWLDGKAICEGLGRRYCTDDEWFEGCVNATGLVDMTGAYEWVAEEAGGVAQKRGSADCNDASAHVITDPYEFRCCGPMI